MTLTLYTSKDHVLSIFCRVDARWFVWDGRTGCWDLLPEKPSDDLEFVTGDYEVQMLRQMAISYMQHVALRGDVR